MTEKNDALKKEIRLILDAKNKLEFGEKVTLLNGDFELYTLLIKYPIGQKIIITTSDLMNLIINQVLTIDSYELNHAEDNFYYCVRHNGLLWKLTDGDFDPVTKNIITIDNCVMYTGRNRTSENTGEPE